MKVGTIFAPKKESYHHKRYGDFVGKIEVEESYFVKWSVIEEGNGVLRESFGIHLIITSHTRDFEDITEIYNSPLWKALG